MLKNEKWLRFKSHKRGYISLWIFLIFFILSLFSEIIANDHPLFIYYKGKAYFPIVKTYSEKIFGGDFDTEADYKDEYVTDLIEKDGYIIWAPIKYKYSTINYSLSSGALSGPSLENILGTDSSGRDVFANIIYGFRISVLFGIALTILSSIIGLLVGAIQGYYGGKIDIWGQRFIEVWSGMPTLFILIILSSIVEPNFWWLLLITVLFGWMSLVSVVRAEFLRARNLEYVLAARALGLSNVKIIFKHILPNALVATLTFLPFILVGSVTTLTGLDFLGFGLPIGSPSLGDLLAQGKNNLQAPWLGLSSFIVITLILILIIFIGEATRDAFDPRSRRPLKINLIRQKDA